MNNNTLALQWTSATTNARVSSNQVKIKNLWRTTKCSGLTHPTLAPPLSVSTATPAPDTPLGAAALASPGANAVAGTGLRHTMWKPHAHENFN